MKDTVLVFDLDGTLHKTEKIYIPVFEDVYEKMKSDGISVPGEFHPSEATKYLGCNVKEMWADFMPNAPKEVTAKYSSLIGLGMIERLGNGEGVLYDGAEEMLKALKNQGYRMVLLSNCRIKYMENISKSFGFDKYFEGFYPCERYDFIPKEDIFEYIKDEHPAEEYVVIGDRRHDMALAKHHDLRSVGCLYGYGSREELIEADFLAASPSDILDYLKN